MDYYAYAQNIINLIEFILNNECGGKKFNY